MTTILKYAGALAALAIAVLVLAPVGELIRDATPARFHTPLAASGMVIFIAAFICLAVCKMPPFSMGRTAWRTSMSAGLIVGFLMYCFYISGVDCETTRRGGFSCHYTGAE